MTRTAYTRLTLGIVACLTLAGFFVLIGMFSDEYWCDDRWPWWGPPKNPHSSCTGHSWAYEHPGEYPWTLPK